MFDLLEREIERHHVLGRRGGALHQVIREVNEDLARAGVAGATRLMQPVVDVDTPDVVRELGDAFQLLLRDCSKCRINFYTLAEDDDVHVLPIEFGARLE